MAATVPNSLKSADITRFAARAAQVEKAKPAVSYWCTYWIVQQLVTKGLHNTDDESRTYTSELMDKLESMKALNDDAIVDETAGQALIEQFGLEVFTRADNAIRANKASRQTADTFQAAYTFLELLQIWPPVDPEITSKIKFAKYHAVRIAKAIKAGEDPNVSNPQPEQASTQIEPPLDPNDLEVQALQSPQPGVVPDPASRFRQPSVEEVPDEHDRTAPSLAQTSNLNQSLHPSRGSSIPRPNQNYAAPTPPPAPIDVENYYQTAPANGEVSPLGPPSTAAPPSIGGGYFPRVPDDPHAAPDSDAPLLPSAPGGIPGSPPDATPISPPADITDHPPVPDFPSSPAAPPPPQQYPPHPPPPATQPHQGPQFHHHHPPPPTQPSYSTYGSVSLPSAPTPQQADYYHQATAPPPPQAVAPTQQQEEIVPDEETIAKAQKHARWAISALNFDDVATAVKELRGALETLGAR